MATYTETGSGGAECSGCAIIEFTPYIYYPFIVGDTAYSQEAAQRGKIEKVVIKKMDVLVYYDIIRYIDTLNRLWLSNDLVTLTVATSLYNAFYQRQDDLERNLKCISA
jgi:hypothetical protein